LLILVGVQETHLGKVKVLSPEAISSRDLNLPELMIRLLQTVLAAAHAVDSNQVSIEKNGEQETVRNVMHFFVACANSSSTLLNSLFNGSTPLLKEFIRFILLQTKDTTIQTDVSEALYEICNTMYVV
jgi:hypothetical protein